METLSVPSGCPPSPNHIHPPLAMFSFCTGSHGLLDDEFANSNNSERRRPRHSSMPDSGTARSTAGVKRGASVGRKGGRPGGQNLKAMIGQPTNFVHVSHGDGSSTMVSRRPLSSFAEVALADHHILYASEPIECCTILPVGELKRSYRHRHTVDEACTSCRRAGSCWSRCKLPSCIS